jgi:hypothetical protein
MDGGALIYILIFVVLVVLQGIGQKRREAERKGRPAQSRPDAPPAPPQGEERPLPRRRDARESSEGMIPSEVWEEILGLARGKPQSPAPAGASAKTRAPSSMGPGTPSSGAPATRPSRSPATLPPRSPGKGVGEEEIRIHRPPGSLEEIPSFEARSLEKVEARRAEVSAKRAPSPPQRVRPTEGIVLARSRLGRRRSAQGREIRRELLGSGSAEELRRAMVLSEVLGPPLSLRE